LITEQEDKSIDKYKLPRNMSWLVGCALAW